MRGLPEDLELEVLEKAPRSGTKRRYWHDGLRRARPQTVGEGRLVIDPLGNRRPIMLLRRFDRHGYVRLAAQARQRASKSKRERPLASLDFESDHPRGGQG